MVAHKCSPLQFRGVLQRVREIPGFPQDPRIEAELIRSGARALQGLQLDPGNLTLAGIWGYGISPEAATVCSVYNILEMPCSLCAILLGSLPADFGPLYDSC